MRQQTWTGRIVGTAAGVLLASLFIVHFLHLKADFPNFSPWMDYAKYTDEGWYGSAALAYFVRGGWYVAGDFNPGVALPVWPMLEWFLFHFTGVSLSAARALAVTVFGGNLLLTFLLVRRVATRGAAFMAALLLVSNAFLYCFSRVAILEPLLSFWMLLAWQLTYVAERTRPVWLKTGLLIILGLVLSAMVLTKTTAVFLLPAIFYLLWATSPRERKAALVRSAVVVAAAGISWSIYYLQLVRPTYLEDYRYLFTANVWPQPTTVGGWLMAFWYSLHGTLWIDPRFAVLAALLVALTIAVSRSIWRTPLFTASVLAISGYLFFIGFHNNMQPRYYQIVAYPLVILAVLAAYALFAQPIRALKLTAVAAMAGMAALVCINSRQTLWFALHPQYTFVTAAQQLTQYIDQHPNRNRLLLSISGSNIEFVTGLPAICDDFGTLELPDRIRKYQPGWYAAWNELDPGTLEDLHTQFDLQEVASFPAYDDEDRNNLILYKLIPLREEPEIASKHSKKRHPPLGARAGRAQIQTIAARRR